MENRAFALSVGLFTLLLGAAAVFAIMWFSGDTEPRETYLLESAYPVTGLNTQAPVRFRGVEVGRVESIAFDRDNPRTIQVAVSVRSGTPLTRGTYARLGTQGVTGLAYIILDDEGNRPEALTPEASREARIPVRQSFFDEIAGTGRHLVSDANEVARRLNALLAEPNQAQLMTTLASLEEATRAIAQLARRFEPALRGLPAVTEDARKALAGADTLIANMNRLALELGQRVDMLERVSRGAEQVGGAAQAFSGAAVSDTLPRINALLEELARNSRNLDRFLSELNEQPGSLVFGRPAVAPGPGEPGFEARRGGGR